MKDPKQFRERFKKWKEGTPIEEIYDNGRPTYFESVELLASPMAKNWNNIKGEFKPSTKYVGTSYSNGKDDRTYIGGSNQELVVTPGKSWVNPYTGEYTRATESYAQPIASKDPYVDYQFYSPTGNSIVQTINSTPRWQQYWADQEGARVAEAKKNAAPYILNLLMSVDAAARLPEFALEIPEIYKAVKYGARQGLRRMSPSYDLYKTISETTPKVKARKPTIRTKFGDVEIDNPNLLYHLDRGDNIGAFSNHGAFLKEGKLFPGTPKDNGSISYSWWNKGKPYATHINGEPMTRLMTTTEDTPGMLHVRSQKYPIGQWDGKKGLVTKAEYVNSNPVDVEGSIYMLDPDYGYRKVIPNVPTAEFKATPSTPKIANGYSLSIEDALKDIDFDFEVTGAPRTWWDIMLKKRPEIAIERWNKLGLDKNSNPIISDRTSLDAAKNIFNANWYKSRLSEISNSTDDIVNQFNRNIDNTTMFARDPGSELGLTADGRTISRLHFGIGIDGNPTTILKNNIFIHPDALTRSGRFLHHSDKMVNEIIKHEGLHASSGVGLLMPKEIKVNNTLYHMTPKQNIKDESIRRYMDIDDEQRVRLLKFADIAERKFNGNYEKAYDYLADNYYTWAINDVPHDVMELLYYFDKPEVINAGKHILGFAAPITAVSALSNQYKYGKDSGIYIKPSKRGTFTTAAKKRGMSVLSFASKVLNNPSNYSKAMRKKALFAKNASKFKH